MKKVVRVSTVVAHVANLGAARIWTTTLMWQRNKNARDTNQNLNSLSSVARVTDITMESNLMINDKPASLQAAKDELRVAENALRRMSEAAIQDDFAAAWKQFLDSLEKVWNKTEVSCRPIRTQFEPWQCEFKALRRNDELLRYVKHARDADNHGIQAIIAPVRAGVAVSGPGTIMRGKISGSGEVTGLQTVGPIRIEELFRLMPVSVENRGTTHAPPTSHLGVSIGDPSPLVVGEKALTFYRDFVAHAEARFLL